MTGPGQKYVLGLTTQAVQAEREEARLPETYGTGKLLLAVRDPHWLYAHWDLGPQQQRQYNAASADRHLVLRLFRGAADGPLVKEVHVHPESRHWFIHVERAETQYVTELGYYRPGRQWVTVATSTPALTPPDAFSADQTARYATIPAQLRLAQLAALGKQAEPADLVRLEPAQERALAELVTQHPGHPEQMSSMAAQEPVRGPEEQEIFAAQAGIPALPGGASESISSPAPTAEPLSKGFWLNLNAELIVYGATAPDASVMIGGESVPLRPDGTFSCRIALPDGEYALLVSALSAEGELRQADLKVTRRTDHHGEVGQA